MAFASSRIGAQEAIIIPCDLCEEAEDVNWFCRDCGQNMCSRCKRSHLRTANSKDHELLSISEGFIIGKQNIPNMCVDHADPFSFYCKTCKMNICSKCLSHNHRKHDFVDLRVVGEELQKELSDTIKEKTKEKGEIEQNIESLTRFENEFDSYVAASHASIDERVQAICDTARAEGNALKSSLNTARERKTREARKLRGKLQTQSDAYIAKISEIERDVRLQTNLTMPEFAEKSQSELHALKPSHVSIPSTIALFTEGKVNTDVIRDMIGRVDNRSQDVVPVLQDEDDRGDTTPVLWDQLNIVGSIGGEETFPAGVRSVCSSPDGNIWAGCFGTVLKVDMKGKILTKIGCREGYASGYIACFTSGDAVVSYGGTSYLDRFTPGGKRINFADMSPHRTYDIAVTNENQVVVNVNMNLLVILSERGRKLREIKLDVKEFLTFCLLQDGSYRIAEYESPYLVTVDTNGKVTKRQKITKSDIYYISSDRHGNVIASNDDNDSIYVISEDGRIVRTYGIPGKNISRLTVDNKGRLLIGTNNKTITVAEYTE